MRCRPRRRDESHARSGDESLDDLHARQREFARRVAELEADEPEPASAPR
jgi:hypothetical protein